MKSCNQLLTETIEASIEIMNGPKLDSADFDEADRAVYLNITEALYGEPLTAAWLSDLMATNQDFLTFESSAGQIQDRLIDIVEDFVIQKAGEFVQAHRPHGEKNVPQNGI